MDADAVKILSRYDRDRDGKLSLSEFLKAITPISYEYQQKQSSGLSYTQRNSYLGLSYSRQEPAKTLVSPV